MGQLILPRLLLPGVKPTESVAVDWSHQMAQGLMVYAIGHEDLVSGGVATPVNSYATSGYNYGRGGFALESHSTTNGGWRFDGASVAAAQGQPFGTLATIVEIDSWVNWAQMLGVPVSKTAWSNPFQAFALARSNNTSSGAFFKDIGGTTNGSTSGTGYFAADGVLHHYVVTTDETDTVSFYKDGVIHSTDTLAQGAGNFTFDQTTPYFFSRNSTADGEGTNARSYLQAFWNRELSAGEVAQFYAVPDCLLKPKVPAVYFTPSAATLDNDRISSMHFQRHYEPIAMGS